MNRVKVLEQCLVQITVPAQDIKFDNEAKDSEKFKIHSPELATIVGNFMAETSFKMPILFDATGYAAFQVCMPYRDRQGTIIRYIAPTIAVWPLKSCVRRHPMDLIKRIIVEEDQQLANKQEWKTKPRVTIAFKLKKILLANETIIVRLRAMEIIFHDINQNPVLDADA